MHSNDYANDAAFYVSIYIVFSRDFAVEILIGSAQTGPGTTLYHMK